MKEVSELGGAMTEEAKHTFYSHLLFLYIT